MAQLCARILDWIIGIGVLKNIHMGGRNEKGEEKKIYARLKVWRRREKREEDNGEKKKRKNVFNKFFG